MNVSSQNFLLIHILIPHWNEWMFPLRRSLTQSGPFCNQLDCSLSCLSAGSGLIIIIIIIITIINFFPIHNNICS